MKQTFFAVAAMGCVSFLAASADAEPSKAKAKPAAPSANIDWARPTISFGSPRLEGGTVDKPEATISQLKAQFSMCYERSVVHGWKQEGSADVALVLDDVGKVPTANISAPGIGLDAQAVLCWTIAARKLRFSKPSSGGMQVIFQIAFGAVHAAPPPAAPKPRYWGRIEAHPGGVIESGVGLRDTALVVARWRETVKPCAALARGATDNLWGMELGALQVELDVGADGKVSSIAVSRGTTTLPAPPEDLPPGAAACVSERASKLHFTPREPGTSKLRFTVVFMKEAGPASASATR